MHMNVRISHLMTIEILVMQAASNAERKIRNILCRVLIWFVPVTPKVCLEGRQTFARIFSGLLASEMLPHHLIRNVLQCCLAVPIFSVLCEVHAFRPRWMWQPLFLAES